MEVIDQREAEPGVDSAASHQYMSVQFANEEQRGSDSLGVGNGIKPSVAVHGCDADSDDTPRESLQSSSNGTHSTSMSSLTVSSSGQAYLLMPPQGGEFPTQFSPKDRPHLPAVKEEESFKETNLPKTLSFRTDSTGSMGSLVSSLDLSHGGQGSYETGRSTPDSNGNTPAKRNPNSVSSSSILVSALKQNHRMKKKSVSFSLPTAEDIERRAKRLNSEILFSGYEEFDDNIADYQITSPKGSVNGRDAPPPPPPIPRGSPPRARRGSGSKSATRPLAGIATILLNEESGKYDNDNADSESPCNSPVAGLPPRLGEHGSPLIKRKTSLLSKAVAGANRDRQSSQQGENSCSESSPPLPPPVEKTGRSLDPLDVDTTTSPTPATSALPPSPPPTLMQRVAAASSPEELCAVFGITSESVFLGEVMKKRFSRDLMAKDRFVWIVPRTKSIHWAKNAQDRLDNHKVKYFLLDKNSPYKNTSEMLSTSTSCKEDPIAVKGGGVGSGDTSGVTQVPSPGTPSVRASFGVISLQAQFAPSAGNTPTSAAGSSTTGSTPFANLDTSTSESVTFGEGNNEDAGGFGDSAQDGGGGPLLTSDAAASAAAGQQGDGGADSSGGGDLSLPARASGEMVGIISSAVIHHLSIKIKTESGDYLSLTVSSKGNGVQRAKDWFNVIKTLTKDV